MRTSQVLSELTLARRDLTERVAELRKVASERNALRTRLAQAQAKIEELGSALRAETKLRGDLADAQAGTLAALRARVAELESHASHAPAASPDAERKLAELEQRLAARDAELAARDAELAAREREIAELKAAPGSGKAQGEKSGLRAIRGVGPAYERALIALGVSDVSQIADWTPEQVAEIAPKIKARADRILKDDWIGQARRLCGREQ